jgi:hypothetical protein
MVTSTTDVCCQEPRCDIPALLNNITGTLSPGMIPTLAPPGVISGNANTPTPMPQAPGQTTLAPKPISKLSSFFFAGHMGDHVVIQNFY